MQSYLAMLFLELPNIILHARYAFVKIIQGTDETKATITLYVKSLNELTCTPKDVKYEDKF